MGVGLVPDVPDDLVLGGIKDPVQGDGQLHDPEARREVPAVGGADLDDPGAQLAGQLFQFLQGEPLQLGRGGYSGKDVRHHDFLLTM